VAGSGYLSQNEARIHFGLAQAATVEHIKVTWPSGTVQDVENVKADRVFLIEEPK
jgi:enediyne biosynthesis protein E4